MNDAEKELLYALGVYIAPKTIQKYKHKHNTDENWTRFYYYKNRKPFLVPGSNVRFESEVTSTQSLHKNTFYKMTILSKTDMFYDYYYKLKDHVGNVVVKQNKRTGVRGKQKPDPPKPSSPPPLISENGKFVVSFN